MYNSRRQGCAHLIPSDVQEAMKKAEGVIPFKLYLYLLDNYIKDISPWLNPTRQYNITYAVTLNQILDIRNEEKI